MTTTKIQTKMRNQNNLQGSIDQDESFSSLTLDDQISDSNYDVHKEGKSKKKKLNAKRKMELHKLKKRKQNKYLEIEADEASDEESELDEEIKELIDRDGQKQADFLYSKRDKRRDIVQEMEKKYKQQENDEASVDGLASVEEDEIYPPKIDDPKIWRVICTRGKEKDSVTSLMFKYSSFLKTDYPLDIVSAFHLPKFPGVFFIEAYFEQQALKAIDGFYDIRSFGIIHLEPDQCVSLFQQVEQEKINLNQGQWVRIKQHQLYYGDLGRVLSIDEVKRIAEVKLIPREKREIFSTMQTSKKDNLQVQELEEVKQNEPDSKHNKFWHRKRYLIEQKKFVRGAQIPIKYDPNKYDNEEDLGKNDKTSVYFYNNIREERESSKKDGFIILRTAITNLITSNIKPSNLELQQFYPDVKDIKVVLRKFHSTLKQAIESQYQYQVGDLVQIKDDSSTMKFRVKQVLGDNKLLVRARTKDKQIYEQQVDMEQVRPFFSKYQSVIVISGQYKGESGVIIGVNNHDVAITTEQNNVIHTQVSDLQSQRNIIGFDQSNNAKPNALPTPLQNPSEGSQLKDNRSCGITRNDLIKFGTFETDIGCVLSIKNDQYEVLDITNNIKFINQMKIIGKVNTRNNVSKNQYDHYIRQSDLVAILEGFYKSYTNNDIPSIGCKATVLHVWRDYLFLFSGKFDHSSGVIIEKVTNCTRISSTSHANETRNRSNQHQSQQNNEGNDSFNITRVPDYSNMVGQSITIAGGQWAGYRGLVISVQPKSVKVQLTAKNLTVNVLKEQLGGIQEQIAPSQIQVGKTPHHAPQQSVRIWDYDQDKRDSFQGYQSPYVYTNQTPVPEY